jgi:hypothetical protein|tara:strand:- start:309 stop:482 length:174 start_codon:yes stop_codon:yes gene_type:complete
MLIGYGYGYPINPFQGSFLAASAWAAFNTRADADGATTAEAAVSGCLFGRFATIYNF